MERKASRRDSGGHLKEGGRTGTDGRRGGRVRAALAVGELAIALVLLVGAALLIRSFIALNNEDPGFATQGVLALRLHLPRAAYGEPARIAGFSEQLVERLDGVPGTPADAPQSQPVVGRTAFQSFIRTARIILSARSAEA
jgi:putative ABC transport system permease protein